MKFEVQLKKKCHASVVWPKSADEAVKIVCDLDPADRSVRDLIRGWQESCQEEVDALCSFLDVNDQINVAKEVGCCQCIQNDKKGIESKDDKLN